jgi:hypothetical protein
MYPFTATAIKGTRPKKIPDRSMANDLAELLRRITKNIFQGDNVRKGPKASISVPNRSIFPGNGARNPVRNAAKKRAVRKTMYRGMFRSGIFQLYRIFP